MCYLSVGSEEAATEMTAELTTEDKVAAATTEGIFLCVRTEACSKHTSLLAYWYIIIQGTSLYRYEVVLHVYKILSMDIQRFWILQFAIAGIIVSRRNSF